MKKLMVLGLFAVTGIMAEMTEPCDSLYNQLAVIWRDGNYWQLDNPDEKKLLQEAQENLNKQLKLRDELFIKKNPHLAADFRKINEKIEVCKKEKTSKSRSCPEFMDLMKEKFSLLDQGEYWQSTSKELDSLQQESEKLDVQMTKIQDELLKKNHPKLLDQLKALRPKIKKCDAEAEQAEKAARATKAKGTVPMNLSNK